MANNYVNNAELYSAFCKWKESGEKQIPDYIAKAILQICNNLARRGQFAGYTWKEEMVADAILVCVQFAHNFNPEKSKNAFAYLSMIAYNAFRRRINIEHNKLAIIEKYKLEQDSIYDLNENDNGDDYEFIDNHVQLYDKDCHKSYVEEKEAKKKKKKESAQMKEIDKLFG